MQPEHTSHPDAEATFANQPELASGAESWWMDDAEPNKPFVAHTVGTIGPSREVNPDARHKLAGNMSASYNQHGEDLSQDEPKEAAAARRLANANIHVNAALKHYGLEPSHTAILHAELDYSRPLNIVDVDDPEKFNVDPTNPNATWLNEHGDFLITRDPDKVLAVRPADCPCIIGTGVDGQNQEVLFLAHYPWRGANAGFLEQGLDYLHSQGVSNDSLRLYMAAGMGAETSRKYFYSKADPTTTEVPGSYTHPDRASLFTNVTPTVGEDGETKFVYGVDVQGFLQQQLRQAGLKDWQLFIDETDTAAPETGHHSHSRAVNYPEGESKGADILIATMHDRTF